MATVADYVIGDLLFLFPGQLDGYIVTPCVQHAFLVLRERHRNMAMRRVLTVAIKFMVIIL